MLLSKNKNKETDILNGSAWRNIPKFALPLAATGILGQLFNASDIAIVGNFTGSNGTAAVAAVGANSPLIGLIVNLLIGISLGANVVIANAVGQNDDRTVHKTVHTSVLISIICGIAVMLGGELVSRSVLSVLNVPDDVFPFALTYLRIYLLGLPVILLYNFEAAIFRSIGDTKTPLIALALSGVLNIFLNMFFVIVLKMTVDGVAIATVISNAVSSAILLVKLIKTEKIIHLELKQLAIDKSIFVKIIKIGLPAGIQSAVFSISNIVIQSAINSLGTVVMAASSAAFNIEIFVYYILNSFSQACTTFVGQNYGAGQIERCKKIMFICLIQDAIATAITAIIALTFGKFLIAIFDSNPDVVETGYTRLVMIFTMYVFTVFNEILSGYLRGFKISLTPAIMTMIGVCGVRIIWIYTVFPQSRTFKTIMTSYPISMFVAASLIGIAVLIYRPSKRFANRG